MTDFSKADAVPAERIYTQEILLATNDCDMTGGWKPSAIMNAMQEAAGTHGTMLGFGRKVLDPLGLVWVVSRLEVQLNRCPRLGEKVTLVTYPAAMRRLFFPRYYIMKDASGQQVGCASTLWLLMDTATRRMSSSELVRSCLPDNRDLTPPMGLPAPGDALSGTPAHAEYTPVYADLDVNGHVNNTRYMDLCCNTLGIETLRSRYVSRFFVSFDKEIRADQKLTTTLLRDDSSFAFSGFEGDTRHFDISGVLTGR